MERQYFFLKRNHLLCKIFALFPLTFLLCFYGKSFVAGISEDFTKFLHFFKVYCNDEIQEMYGSEKNGSEA